MSQCSKVQRNHFSRDVQQYNIVISYFGFSKNKNITFSNTSNNNNKLLNIIILYTQSLCNDLFLNSKKDSMSQILPTWFFTNVLIQIKAQQCRIQHNYYLFIGTTKLL